MLAISQTMTYHHIYYYSTEFHACNSPLSSLRLLLHSLVFVLNQRLPPLFPSLPLSLHSIVNLSSTPPLFLFCFWVIFLFTLDHGLFLSLMTPLLSLVRPFRLRILTYCLLLSSALFLFLFLDL